MAAGKSRAARGTARSAELGSTGGRDADTDRFSLSVVRGRHPFAYLPFSLGPRICIGMQFALYGARLVLATILGRYRVRPVDEQPVGCRAAGTLRPNRDILVKLETR